MGVLNTVKNFFTGEGEREYDDITYGEDGDVGFIGSKRNRQHNDDNSKIVDIHTTTKIKVILQKPEHFDEVSSIADHLNKKRTVVLNLESANREVAKRIIDFLSGVAYANDGEVKNIATKIFIITPYNVDLEGNEFIDELESNGVIY